MSGERQIITVLEELHRHGTRNDDAIVAVLRREVDCFRNPTDSHAVWWNAKAWCEAEPWSADDHHRLTQLAEVLRADHPHGREWVLISRDDVFARRTIGEVDLFLAAMAWGFGDRGYGWQRTAEMTRAAETAGGITSVVQGLQAAWEQASAIGTARAWSRHGAAKVPGLDTAFASKLAYYACYDREKGAGPLIADQNTAWSVWALAGIEGSLKQPDAYQQYVTWASDRAGDLGCRSDDLERALFVLGPDVKQIWTRLGA